MKLELEPIDRVTFESTRDVHSSGYMGLERRIKNRRVTPDRRQEIRYDAKSSDRRSGIDRRRNSQNWKYNL